METAGVELNGSLYFKVTHYTPHHPAPLCRRRANVLMASSVLEKAAKQVPAIF